MKKLLLFVGLLFLLFSFLQINDPDSSLWILAYLIPAALSFLAIINYRRKYFQYISPFYLIMAAYLYLNNSNSTIIHIFDETTNESMGLVLCSIWIFILPWLKIKSNREIER